MKTNTKFKFNGADFTLHIIDKTTGKYIVTDAAGDNFTDIPESRIMEVAADAVAKLTTASTVNRWVEARDEENTEFFEILKHIGIDAEFPSDRDMISNYASQISCAIYAIADQFDSILN